MAPSKTYIGFLILCFFIIFTLYFHTQMEHLTDSNIQLEKLVQDLRQKLVEEKQSSPVSLAPDMRTEDNLVVIYNRVPKTGSTSFVGVAYDLCKQNNFRVLHINITANMHVMSLENQYKFAHNITNWNRMKPAFYHGHMAYLEFSRLGMASNPLFINLLRKPLDRLVSYYYFLRNGDNFRPYLVRRKHGNKMTFDECVELKQPDCDPNNMWLQIPFLCGHAAECWEPGNKWALGQAKRNLINRYFVVGVTEELEDFVKVLESALPRMFKGATEYFQTSNKSHLRQTVSKLEPTEKTVSAIQKSVVWQMENELYEFAAAQFAYIKKKVLTPNGIPQVFFYEKIRPKSFQP